MIISNNLHTSSHHYSGPRYPEDVILHKHSKAYRPSESPKEAQQWLPRTSNPRLTSRTPQDRAQGSYQVPSTSHPRLYSSRRLKRTESRKTSKIRGKTSATLTFLEVENKWAREHPSQDDKHTSEMGDVDFDCDEDGNEGGAWNLTTAADITKDSELNFGAVSFAEGKEFLKEEGRVTTRGRQ